METTAHLGLRFALGRFRIVPRLRLGLLTVRATRPGSGATWTAALATGIGLRLEARFAQRWMLLAAPLDFSAHWNDLWITCWTPQVGAGFTF
jgi:hypothetical protein